MLNDSFELEVTTESTEMITAINEFYEQLLSVGNNLKVILEAVAADPTSVLINTLAATFYLFIGSPDATQQATFYLTTAKDHLADANERENLYFLAIEAWANRDLAQAIVHHEEIAEHFPRDLASVYVSVFSA